MEQKEKKKKKKEPTSSNNRQTDIRRATNLFQKYFFCERTSWRKLSFMISIAWAEYSERDEKK